MNREQESGKGSCMEEMKQKREKVKQAVALSYDPEEDAPKVIASGRGHWQNESLKERRKQMSPCTGMISLQIPYPDWKSEI